MEYKDKTKKIKLVYVGFAFEHHKGTHGGYHHIAEYGNYDYIIDCQKFSERCGLHSNNFFIRAWKKILRIITGFPVLPSFLFKMVILSFRFDCVFHVIYGEANYTPWIRWLTRRGTKIVCTLHQPFEWYDNKWWRRNLKQMDNVILVGDKEIPLFKKVTQKNNVVFIPHGVFTDYYKPNRDCKKEKILLTVGNWLRDYKFADSVYSVFLQKHPDWNIAVVANATSTKVIHNDERIKCLTGISDDQLKSLYLRSTVLFLPLLRYTANNSLLEAAASGCNILIASNSTDNSYIPLEFLEIAPLDIHKILDKMESLISRTNYNTALADYVDRNYSWTVIGQQVHNFLINA